MTEIYFAKTTTNINHYLISYGTGYEAVETVETYPEKVRILGPESYSREFDAKTLLEALEKVGSSDEVREILLS